MHAISVKYLREKFPFVRSELKKGESFLIIHKSIPIAQLKPIAKPKFEETDEEFKDFERAAVEDLSEYLPPLTKEEHDYYMSLAPRKD